MNDLKPTDWRDARLTFGDKVSFALADFMYSDLFMLKSLLNNEPLDNDVYESLKNLYVSKPSSVTAHGLKMLVDANIISDREADALAASSQERASLTDDDSDARGRPSTPPTLRPDIPAGLHVFVGPSGAGKSRTLARLSEELNLPLIIAAEPDHRSIGDIYTALKLVYDALASMLGTSRVALLEGSFKHLADKGQGSDEALHRAIVQANGLCLDSIKSVLYISGNLGKGGVSMTALNALSDVAALTQLVGVRLFTVINPLRDDMVEDVLDALEGAVTGVWSLENENARGRVRVFNGEYYEREIITLWSSTRDNSSRAVEEASSPILDINSNFVDLRSLTNETED